MCVSSLPESMPVKPVDRPNPPTDHVLRCRITAQCQSGVAIALHAFGKLDILLCCNSQTVVGTVEELGVSPTTQALVRDQFETNYFGPVNVIKAVLDPMRAAHTGHIIILGGVAGHLGTPGLGIFCASNWALEGFCDSIAYEIAPFNIKVTIVQANVEIGILTNRVTSAPPHFSYTPEANDAPLFRGILDGILNRLPGISDAGPRREPDHSQSPSSPPGQSAKGPGPNLLSRDQVMTLYPPLSPAHTSTLIAETVHCILAIGGHENPPARHIVGWDAVASVKEKLKTVSEELEDFVEASTAVDVDQHAQRPARQGEAEGGQQGPVDFGLG